MIKINKILETEVRTGVRNKRKNIISSLEIVNPIKIKIPSSK